ncbi:ATP-dependent DNA helicase RecG [bacterium]|nr:ATP-dependent DNA helicase RecG [bacterium]
MNLETPIKEIPKIGPFFLRKLQRMGIRKVKDILFHFPHRYENFSNIGPISKIQLNQTCCVLGKILEIRNSRTWKKKMLLTQALIEDKSGAIKAVWFNQPYLNKVLKKGDNVCFAGKVSLEKDGLYLSNPAYEKITSPQDLSNLTHTGRIVPVYPETEGLSSRWFRYILKPLLLTFKNKIPETLPQHIIDKFNLLPIEQAIWQIHFPDSLKLAEKARNRFSFEELFLIELFVLRERLRLRKEKAISIPPNIEITREFVKSLPFKLTNAQRKAAWQILKDLEKTNPMSRLLEGDVGSGKTVVSIIAALNVVKAGYQVAFMAPTEILAKQHFKEVSKLLKNFNVKIALLTGKEDKIISQKLFRSTSKGPIPEILEISRNKLLDKVRGKINPQTKKFNVGVDILIGTHSLIQNKVKFGKLALCVVDEQHRFGVEQRAKLTTKSNSYVSQDKEIRKIPHFLSMTATPIPRTLALTIYGDLDISILDEMPKGRKKIATKIILPQERKKIYKFIKERVKRKEQVFVICPRIESPKPEPENSKTQGKTDLPNTEPQASNNVTSWAEVKAVKEEYKKFSKEIFPDLKIAMLHGKMTPKEKEKTMEEFKRGKIDILISTSVVEVGIDVPKATVMVIEGAERFGLAQLYQLRGRVGRSNLQSYCLLFTDSKTGKTKQRLKAILKAKNGFELAQKDLEIRGPGSLYGVKQWGIPDLAMENLKNLPLVEKTREIANELLEKDPDLQNYPLLKKRLEGFEKRIHLE